MESPVIVDKPPEYHGNDRGFPFDEEEGSGAWSELAARHPDIAARLRQRPATWARKRRPSSQDATTDDFGESFSGFDRFPFDDIPPEFREHFPSRWNRRFSDRDQPPEEAPRTPQQQQSPPSPQPQHHTAATQTEHEPHAEQEQTLPQYGLRNTVDLGQKSPADPSVDADDRTQRSVSAPPDAPRTLNPNMPTPGGSAHPPPHQEQQSNVRHIPIFVEGRDEPIINKNADHGAHFSEPKPTFQQPPPPQPHIDRDQYFADDGPVGFHHPPNFTRAFGTPFSKGFRQGPQPFVQQKAYPQNAFTRGASPQRSQSPKPHPHQEEHFVKVPVHHEHAAPKTEHPSRAQQKPPPPPPKQPSPQQQAPPAAPQPRENTPPPKPQPPSNDPITQILSIQTDVLNLMTEVENFKGAKKDKRYLFLDEMLTRNLIKLDNIETEGKENIRQARKEAIKCIEKCIAVLEAKADSNTAKIAQAQDEDMNENAGSTREPEPVSENGEVEVNEPPKEEKVVSQADEAQPPKEEIKENTKRGETPKPQEEQTQEPKTEAAPPENTESNIPATDTRPVETKPESETDKQTKEIENKSNPKKKVVKKRNKSKEAAKDSHTEEASKDSDKTEVAETGEKGEVMHVDDKGDKPMEVDGAASQ